MSTFSIYDLSNATLDDFMTVEFSMTDEQIHDAIDSFVSIAREQVQPEIEEMSKDASYPFLVVGNPNRTFEDWEEYEGYLNELADEEAEEYRTELFEMVKIESDLYRNLETLETIDYLGSTMQDDYIADCPICGQSVTTDEDGDLVHCHHFLGTFNAWYDEDETQRNLASQATHRVIWTTSVAGNPEAYFKTSILDDVMTASEVSTEFNITRQAVHDAINAGRITSRQSGQTHLMLRKDVERLWKALFWTGLVVGFLAQIAH